MAQQPAGGIEVSGGRRAQVGAIEVLRLLPQRARRTVGAWCFADVMGPGQVGDHQGLDVGPHPHIGLQTVTWLLAGEVVHHDSLGSEQAIRPGQLNLMTAGRGVSHSEETRGRYAGPLHGIQLWVAQPDATRHGEPAFEHHPDLPQLGLAHGVATVLVGRLGDAASPARRDTDHLGAELALQAGTSTIAIHPTHEHAVLAIDAPLDVAGVRVEPGQVAYVPVGHEELALRADGPARAMLLGGVPFEAEPLMWWNYVARTRQEVVDAHRSWTDDDGRFGHVASDLARVNVAPPPWPSG